MPIIDIILFVFCQVLNNLGRGSKDIEDFMCGFHWPIVSVRHLHMHVIAPTAAMNFFKRIEFSRKYFFGTVEQAIVLIEKREN